MSEFVMSFCAANFSIVAMSLTFRKYVRFASILFLPIFILYILDMALSSKIIEHFFYLLLHQVVEF